MKRVKRLDHSQTIEEEEEEKNRARFRVVAQHSAAVSLDTGYVRTKMAGCFLRLDSAAGGRLRDGFCAILIF